MSIDALALQELREEIEIAEECGVGCELSAEQCATILALLDERDARIDEERSDDH